MPKRVIDFDAIWASDKLAACAEWAQAEYAWFYGLADASGSFELTNLRVIWGRVAAVRKNLSLERLEQVFDEFRDKGLLFVWEENGKRYAHWTGSDVPGRLPPPSWRNRLEKLAPPVPRGQLAKYLGAFSRSVVPPRAHSAPVRDAMHESRGSLRDGMTCSATHGALRHLKPALEPAQAQEGDLERDWRLEREEDEERAATEAREKSPSLPDFPREEDGSEKQSVISRAVNSAAREISTSGAANNSQFGAGRAPSSGEIPRPAQTAGLGMTAPEEGARSWSWSGAHELLAIYAEERGALPEAREVTTERSMKCAERLRAVGAGDAPEFLRGFRDAVRRATRTPFLCGANGRHWRATFDWFIANDMNVCKVLEGRDDAFARASSGEGIPARSLRDEQVQRELRVGLGPSGPYRVKPEALERDRLRREAERAASLAKHGGARRFAARPR